jgi:hypothetical protein
MAAPPPEDTCAAIAEELPDLYVAFGEERVLAACEEIQNSEIPEQSALFQDMFRLFNGKYFDGRLPEYRILVVYDVWFWETQRCGFSPVFPPAAEATGFIDFEGRRVFHQVFSLFAQRLDDARNLNPRDGPRSD